MTPTLKLAALTVGAATAAYEVITAALQQVPVPDGTAIGGGVTGGFVVGAMVWAAYKQKVDTLEKKAETLERTKADKEAVAEMGKSIDRIEEHVTWLVREKRGE